MSANFVDAAALDDLWEGAGFAAQAGGQDIALFKVGEAVFATAAMCSHGQARLCDGYVEGFEVECPLHQGRLDLRTGAPCGEPITEGIKTYPVRIEGGRVWVAV